VDVERDDRGIVQEPEFFGFQTHPWHGRRYLDVRMLFDPLVHQLMDHGSVINDQNPDFGWGKDLFEVGLAQGVPGIKALKPVLAGRMKRSTAAFSKSSSSDLKTPNSRRRPDLWAHGRE
jgi:hypothetical protein